MTPGATHVEGDVAGLFRGYEAIVLVANSESADLELLRGRMPAHTLFVFFNEARRVLSEPFTAPSVLVARSGKEGPAIVRKKKIAKILPLFAPGALKAVVNLRCAERENFVGAERFGHDRVAFLDLTDYFLERYTATKTASSGYAMIAWLIDKDLGCPIHGLGFTGRRGEKFRIFDVHDWALERIALRLFEASGRVTLDPTSILTPGAMLALQRQFPNESPQRFLEIGFEVLAQRIERTDMFVDRLWSVTAVGRGVREVFKLFRSKKGKQL